MDSTAKNWYTVPDKPRESSLRFATDIDMACGNLVANCLLRVTRLALLHYLVWEAGHHRRIPHKRRSARANWRTSSLPSADTSSTRLPVRGSLSLQSLQDRHGCRRCRLLPPAVPLRPERGSRSWLHEGRLPGGFRLRIRYLCLSVWGCCCRGWQEPKHLGYLHSRREDAGQKQWWCNRRRIPQVQGEKLAKSHLFAAVKS